jgi:lysyl endopeptidase
MKNILALVIIFSFVHTKIYAQLNIGGQPYSWNNEEVNKKIGFSKPDYESSYIDWQKVKAEDIKDSISETPPRFGYDLSVDINIMQVGKKILTTEGDQITTFKISCKGALSINLLYDKFWLPSGAKLYLFRTDRKQKIGGFTDSNNKGLKDNLKGFGTGLIYGEEMILELFEPKESINQSVINIAKVIYGYRKIKIPKEFEQTEVLGSSGPCQVNVNCIEGNSWQSEKRGVAMILVNGNRYCTGSLIRGNIDNGELYFLTADHCLGGWANSPVKDAVSNPNCPEWSFMWNYEAGGCSNPSIEPNTTLVTTGATVVANWNNTDFALLRLTESPFMLPTPYNAYYNGWARYNSITSSGVCIHHPAGDIKKIATYTTTPAASSSIAIPGGVLANYWQVGWAATPNGFSVTEGGSSGSPLFNSSGLITGQLFGGSSINCSNPAMDPGVYGKFYISWGAGATPQRRLRDWLDPTNVSPLFLSGSNPSCIANFIYNQNVSGLRYIQAVNIETSTSNLNSVSSSGTLHLRGASKVVLKPGFSCSGKLRAYIGNCL